MKLSRRSAMIGSQESETGSDVGSCFYGRHFVFVDNGNKTLKESKGDQRRRDSDPPQATNAWMRDTCGAPLGSELIRYRREAS